MSSFGLLGSCGCSRGETRLTRLRRLPLVDVAALVLPLVAAVVVPAALPSIVVVTQDQRVYRRRVTLSIRNVSDSMELFADGSLHDHVLLVLMVLPIRLEVQLVVVGVRHHHLCTLHMHRNRQNAMQREVWVLNVPSVDLFVLVEKVGILELLDGFLGDLADPVVHAETPVLQNHFLQVIELVTLIIISI